MAKIFIKFLGFIGGIVLGAYAMYNHCFRRDAKNAIKEAEEKLRQAEAEKESK